jgi:carboxyl-terminal processing protease
MKRYYLYLFLLTQSSYAQNSEILKKVWETGSKKACSLEMQKAFSHEARLKLETELKNQEDVNELARVLNPFLANLKMSHTEFMTTSSEGYYFFKSYSALTNKKIRPIPKIQNPGIQLGHDGKGYFVREVLTGFPADKAGIKKKDRILSLNDKPFNGTWLSQHAKAKLTYLQNETQKEIDIEVKSLDWNQAFQDATSNSVKIINSKKGKKIGYIRLWSGVHPQSADLIKRTVKKFKRQNVSSLILDLRGGYGGAWWEHLDAFYPDTSTYMQMEILVPHNESEMLKSPFKKNQNTFDGPMVVLTNEGVRSGKEALAHQFKKTKRAVLVGEKTPGYFSTGQFFYVEEPLDYLFYLCVYQLKLDGEVIEGRGIQPDYTIGFQVEGEYNDSQLNFAVEYLSK